MRNFTTKEFLSLKMPAEDAPLSDQQRITLALQTLGYEHITFPLHVIRKLYPLCRNANFDITVTLVQRQLDWVVTDVEAGDTSARHYGLAVDYGSTTIVMRLVNLSTGAVVQQVSAVNAQVAYGTDILSRITYAMEGAEHRKHLQKATVETFCNLLQQLKDTTGIDAAALPLMVVSGNTTMVHFLLELDAWTVFASPFSPVSSDPGFLWGSQLGMEFAGLLYFVPAASNYVGGDIVSGLLELGIHHQEQTSMFFDIGTNGELVIGNRHWMIAGAGAAGPALEGYISRYGMRAQEGAIDHVKINGQNLTFTTIGAAAPIGICGSGIIDLLAEMRRSGWVDMAGNLEAGTSERIVFLEEAGEYVAVYATAEQSATGTPLYFSQTDIHQYLDTKAAAYTMIDCILETAGVTEADLSRLYLSGAFPAHSDLESAITIGMFPDLPREKYTLVKNSSLEGATQLLLDHALLQQAQHLIEHMYCVQFASVPDFLVRMQAAKFIPHTDMGRFPSQRRYLN